MPGRVVRAVLACTMVVASGAACTAGPSESPPVLIEDGGTGPAPSNPATSKPVPLPPLSRGEQGSMVSWRDCNDDVLRSMPKQHPPALQCTRIQVPLESPAAPGRGQELIMLDKVGTGAAPVVVVNDVSGEPGTAYAVELANRLPKELLSQISLIGVDRRGTGRSDPVRCVPPDTRGELIGADPAKFDVGALIDQAGTAGQQCTIDLEDQLLALDTVRSADDLEQVRDALGVDTLSAIGHGEGSRVLERYADAQPGRVGRLVLDGVPEPGLDAQQALADVAGGAEATFTAFADDCAAHSCPLGANARGTLTALLNQVRTDPLNAGGLTGDGIGPGEVLEAVLTGLADRPNWSRLASALASAKHGDASGITALLTPLMAEDRDDPPRFDVTTVTTCNDTKTRLSPDRIAAVGGDWQHRFPLFGTVVAKRLALCGPWAAATAPPGPMAARGAPPIMVLGTATDPVTPLPGTEHAATALATGVLVTWQGAGHGALLSSDCALSTTQSFLVGGTVPHDGMVCPP